MYSVQLDENGYFTGSYAEVGSVEDGVSVPSLPPDMSKATCYKLEHDIMALGNDGWQNNSKIWIFDDNKWQQLEYERSQATIRQQRDAAFLLIDKYQLTLMYESLTPERKDELAAYRQAWLDAPETLEIPITPEWMK